MQTEPENRASCYGYEKGMNHGSVLQSQILITES